MRFLKDTDYEMQIRNEIKRLLDGSAPGEESPPLKLLRAEKTAISQIRKWLSARVDCDQVFNAVNDERDDFIVTITIDIALYHLYSQSGSKDISQVRQDRYTDALDWLKEAGKGEINSGLPGYPDTEPGEPVLNDIRMISDPSDDNRY